MSSDPSQSLPATTAPPSGGLSEPAPINGEHPASVPATDIPGVAQNGTAQPSTGGLDVVCGPLINYRHMSNELSDGPIWPGSVLIVTKHASQADLELRLRCIGALDSRG